MLGEEAGLRFAAKAVHLAEKRVRSDAGVVRRFDWRRGEWQTAGVMSRQVVLEVPEGVFSALRTEPAEMARELPLAAAVKWYELGKLSQAKAAELAGLSRYEFIHALARFEVSPIQETVEEIAQGLAREQ